jgi:signal transduction histidine kinase
MGPLSAALPIEQYLAAIIAHELSNPFTALAGRVDLMRSRKDLSAPLVRDLDAMKSANERIERILSNLKTFSRRDAPPARPVELLPLVQAAVELFRGSPNGERVEVSIVPWEGAVRAVVDPALLESVIAATLEALAARGGQLRAIEIRLAVNAQDEEVSLLFRDNGPEISEEEVARVFHPFGGHKLPAWAGAITLAYGYYIIRAWGGTFRFRSEGRDTITELCLALQL